MSRYFDDLTSDTSANSLEHWGLKGQKWGIRRFQNPDGTLTPEGIVRYAKKDAKEYARAKMSYGTGAGTRRKLINATVKDRARKNKGYQKEFEKQLNELDMAKIAKKEGGRSHRKQQREKVGVVARGTYHTIVGDGAKVAAGVAAVAGAAKIAHDMGVDKKIYNAGKYAAERVMFKIRAAKLDKDLFGL